MKLDRNLTETFQIIKQFRSTKAERKLKKNVKCLKNVIFGETCEQSEIINTEEIIFIIKKICYDKVNSMHLTVVSE